MNNLLNINTPLNVPKGAEPVADAENPVSNTVKPPLTIWRFLFGFSVSGICVVVLLLNVWILNVLRAAVFESSSDGPSPEGYKVMIEGLDVVFTMLNSLVLTKIMMYVKSNGVYYLYENPLLTRGYPDFESDKSNVNNLSAQKRFKCYERDFTLFFMLSLILSLVYRWLNAYLLMP